VADFDQNRGPTSIRIAGRLHQNYALRGVWRTSRMHRHHQHTCIGARSNDQPSQPPKACLERSPAKGTALIKWRRTGPELGTPAVEIGC
jgi:hypothetical protein